MTKWQSKSNTNVLVGSFVAAIIIACTGAGASAAIVTGQSIGIDWDFSSHKTAGSGLTTNWLNIGDNPSGLQAIDASDGSNITDVTITVTGVNGQMGQTNIGYGGTGVGDYTGTPFSDLSINDGVYSLAGGPVVVTFAGLDNSLRYDVQVVNMARAVANNTTSTTVDGVTITRTDDEYRGVDDVLNPAIFSGAATDGSGNLVITYNSSEAYGIVALYLTAVNAPAVSIPAPAALPAGVALLALGAMCRRRHR